MKRETMFTNETHRYLDGESTPPADETQQRTADGFREAMARYAADLPAPGREVDRAVMAVVRAQPAVRRRSLWSWLFQPQQFSFRPALAAAAFAVVLGVSAVVLNRGGEVTPNAGDGMAASTVLVRFEFRAPEAAGVSLVGSFNEWSDESTPLLAGASDGVWTVTIPLAPGEHEYLFVIDGERWTPDPTAHAQVDDGFGQTNSVITVGPRGVVRS